MNDNEMDGLSLEELQAIQKAINSMTEKLMRLGYIKQSTVYDLQGKRGIHWTDRGVTFKRQMSDIFDTIGKGESLDVLELEAFVILLSWPAADNV
jgi:hypothetical protein